MKYEYILFLILSLLLHSGCSASPGSSKIYIDSVNGSDDNRGDSPISPLKTLDRLKESLAPGDTVYLKAGSVWYDEVKFPSSGLKEKPIVITSYGIGDKPVIDGQRIKRNNIYIHSKKDVVIHNLKLINSNGSGGIRIAHSSNIKIIDCDFIVTGHGGIFIESSNDCILNGNYITSPSGFIHAQTDGIYSQRNNNILIENNRIILKNDQPEEHIDGIQSFLDKNMIVRNNFIFQDNVKTNSQGIYATNSQGTHIYYNNIVHCPNTLASVVGYRNLDKGYGSLELYNNTLISRGSNNLQVTEASDVTVRNNIFVTTSAAYVINIKSRIEDPFAFDHNLYFRAGDGYVVNYPAAGGVKTLEQWQQEGFDLNSILTDPLLDDNFYITADSPAIDAGENIKITEMDFTGSSRKKGKSVDIGAVEFGN